ncbi:MAG: nicotinate phosphoribosyltransferase [Campylobacteraceae bacterium]
MSENIFAKDCVQSILDTDFYKLTMMQAVLHNYPDVNVTFEFKCRNGEDFTPYIDEIKDEIEKLYTLKLTAEERDYLLTIPFLKPDFVRFLKLFRFSPEYVKVGIKNGELSIIVSGPWLHVILFEIPLLAIVSEVRNKNRYAHVKIDDVKTKLTQKIENLKSVATPEELKEFTLADYGTRRRFSFHTQRFVVENLAKNFPAKFAGTSNVHLARLYNVKPLGTMAHEWIMAHQQIGFRLIDSQIAAMDCWVREYRGLLGIALTDCITMDAFLRDFDLFFAKLFDGLRHDSGDPILWAKKAINHYKKLRIDPTTKTLIFSDSLTFPIAFSIFKELRGEIKTSFGIGTNLTCDIEGVKPTNIVVKMVSCNNQPVAKISDEAAKTQYYDESFFNYLGHVFKVNEQ